MPFEESTLDMSDDSIYRFWSCSHLIDDSSVGFPADHEIFMGTYEDPSVMAREILEQVDSSCNALKHTYICLKDVNGSSTEDENCVYSVMTI